MHPYRTLFASALVLALGATPASAAFTGPGGTSTVNSAAQVADAPDDTPCMLEGHIVERVNGEHDKYTFKDATGSVVVEIDDDLFRGAISARPTRCVSPARWTKNLQIQSGGC